jgi:hypothetical protein
VLSWDDVAAACLALPATTEARPLLADDPMQES